MPTLNETLWVQRDHVDQSLVHIYRDNPLDPSGLREVLTVDLDELPDVAGYIDLPDRSKLVLGRMYPLKSLTMVV